MLFPSVNELRARFAEARYIVDQDTIRQVYLASVMQKPIPIGGPPGCGKTEPAKALMFALDGKAPLPPLYGESPGTAPPGKKLLKAGVREVLDQGREVVVLFSVLNIQDHAIELMPPQIQLAGKVKKRAIVKHKVSSNSEQLPVEEFRMSRRRLGPGERAWRGGI